MMWSSLANAPGRFRRTLLRLGQSAASRAAAQGLDKRVEAISEECGALKQAPREGSTMDYHWRFADVVERLKAERRFRVFVDLERDARRFPIAMWRPAGE